MDEIIGIDGILWAIIHALGITIRGSLLGVLGVFPLALFLGCVLGSTSFRGKSMIQMLIMLPLFLPPVATGYLLLLLLGPRSTIGSFLEHMFGILLAFHWQSVAIVAGVVALPLMVRSIQEARETIPKVLFQTSCTLGVSWSKNFRRVTFPLVMPGMIAGSVLGLARAMGEFGATMIFASDIPTQTRTLSLAMNASLRIPGGEILALSFLITSVTMAMGLLFCVEYSKRFYAAHTNS